MGDIRIGTCGWSYPSGPGSWNGIFYPSDAERPRKFDDLAYYAEHFDTVEVNVTFYRPPVAATARRWAERTPADFDFSLKLHQRFTHPGMSGEGVHPPSRPTRERDAPIPQVGAADVDEFKRGIDPIAAAGKLGALLVQFPPGFRRGTATRGYLERLLGSFAEYPLAVEFRHRSWSDAQEETLAVLGAFNAAFVQIDEPKFRFSIRQNYLPNITGIYYMRLHGRNAANWWRHDTRDERYDYLYSAEELRPFAETARAARALVKKAYLYFNNHFAGKAVANAAVLKHELGQPLTGEYRSSLVEQYPALKGIVGGTERKSRPSLFEG
jgi:uncharacterized protein YecE (DUF72 family)